jgi:hypothetical protein
LLVVVVVVLVQAYVLQVLHLKDAFAGRDLPHELAVLDFTGKSVSSVYYIISSTNECRHE